MNGVSGAAGGVSPGDIRQPLGSEAGPLQGVGHHQVIEEGGVLLPYLVLFIDHPLLHGIVKRGCTVKVNRLKMMCTKDDDIKVKYVWVS